MVCSAIFLGFRNTTAYDRYWEARKLWGELAAHVRSLRASAKSLIQLPQLIDPLARDSDACAWCNQRLPCPRAAPATARARRTMAPWSDGRRQRNLPVSACPQPCRRALMLAMGRDLGECVRQGHIAPSLHAHRPGRCRP